MATRRERVLLELDDRFSPGMIRAAAAAKLADEATNSLGGTTVKTNRTLDVGATQARKQARSLDDLESSARRAERGSSALVDILVGLGPALLPVAGVAVPALIGLSAQLGFTVAAAGTTILAFNGIGDALSALNDYQLDPSAANFQKLQESMHGLGPEAQEFVRQLDELGPSLQKIRVTAQNGLLPGVAEGIDDILTRLPEVRSVVAEVARASGELTADAGEALGGRDFDEFFDYLRLNAKPTLTDLGRTLGNFSLSLANLFSATAPEQREFSSWLLGVSRNLEGWTDGLEGNESFIDLMDYIRETGPDVADFFGSLVSGTAAIAKAAGPLGGPTLDILTDVADIVARIADSPVGTPLVALASGLALVNRALSASALAKNSLVADLIYGKQLTSGGRGPNALLRTRAGLDGISSRVKQVGQDVAVMGTTWATAGARSAREIERTNAASSRLRSNLGGVGKGAAAVAGLAFVTSDLADGMNLSNTAAGAMMGTLGGPWGIAVGAAAGAVMDLTAANENLTESIDAADTLLDSGAASFSQYAARRKILVEQLRQSEADLDSPNPLKGIPANIAKEFGTHQRIRDQIAAIDDDTADMSGRLSGRLRGVGSILGSTLGRGLDLLGQDFDNATAASARFYDSLDKFNSKLNLRAALRAQREAVREFARVLKDNPLSDKSGEAKDAREAALDAYAQDSVQAANLTGPGPVQTRRLGEAREQFLKLAAAIDIPAERAKVLADSFGLVDRRADEAGDSGSRAGKKTSKSMDDAKNSAKDAEGSVSGFAGLFNSLAGKNVKPKVDPDTKKGTTEVGAFAAYFATLHGKKAKPRVSVDNAAAFAGISAVGTALSNLNGRSATVYVNRVNQTSGNKRPLPMGAQGGTGDGERSAQRYTTDSSRFSVAPVINVAAPSLNGYRLSIENARLEGDYVTFDDAVFIAEQAADNAQADAASMAGRDYLASNPDLPPAIV